MFCTNCGAENPSDAKFCHRCGQATVSSQAAPPQVSAESSPASQIPNNPHAAAAPVRGASLGRLEIRPRSRRNAMILGVIALLAVGGAFSMLESESEMDQIKAAFGLVSAALALWFAWRLWNRPVSVILHPDRIEYAHGVGHACVPYADIEKIGVKSVMGMQLVGLALKTSENYISSMSGDLKRLSTAGLPFQRFAMPVFQKLFFSFPLAGAVSKGIAGATGAADLLAMAEEAAKAQTIEDNLRINRKHMGFEVWINWYDLDRKPEAFATLLEDYRRRAAEA